MRTLKLHPRLLLATAAMLAASACTGPAPREADARTPAAEDFSVYELDARFRDQAGRERTLSSLGRRVQLVAMVYTECTHTCPRILMELKRIEAALRDDPRVGFTLISLDPKRDTPERLAEFAASTRLDPARWTLLTSDENTVRETAALLGIRYRKEASAEYSHSNSYLVLDAEGRIVHRQSGLEQANEQVLAAIRAALPENANPNHSRP
ncbi:MAG TPA: SCO family protein [Longimicrobium sp.]|jgi:protein SCO1/2